MLHKTSVRLGLVLLLLLMVGAGLGYWYYIHIFVSTDDAYVSGHVGVISPRVPGRVVEVLVDNNQQVSPGQLLLTLDPTDYRVAVDQAMANLARLRQDLSQRYVKVSTAQARVAQTEANFRHAGIDQKRYAGLYERRTVPKQTLDKVNTNYQVSKAELDQARQELRETQAAIGGSTSIPLEEQPAVKEARAQLEQARLNLDYTRLRAQFPGFITRRQVQPGNWVKPGQPLMTLVPLDYRELWIEGNFKETQLAHVYLGQPAEVTVDAYPGTTFKGKVDSIMAGTGAAFSLLPPENATGNWVKVVQRVPVKVLLLPPYPENKPLRLGMSTWVSIDTRNRTGPRLLSAGGK
ncbi:MAG: HlyD family secretion protein [Deltaproteobacteria bacterium]|nr:HlyD family secretion protein [Deltaproteobacteria bacterium]MBI4796711.1 HlyD family secretion protein [Deltaproteobacteria bacterium]